MIRLDPEAYAALQARNRAARTKVETGNRQVSPKTQKARQRVPGKDSRQEYRVIRLELPYPPSVNHYWMRNRGGGMRISKAGLSFRASVKVACRDYGKFAGEVCVGISSFPPDKRRRDIDNIAKAILDAIQHAGIINDDYQVGALHIVRHDPRPGGAVRVEIWSRSA